MAVRFGGTEPVGFRLGTVEPAKLILGSETVWESGGVTPDPPDTESVDSSLFTAGQNVLAYLQSRAAASTAKWVSGQHIGYRSSYSDSAIDDIESTFGDRPAILGYDLGSGAAGTLPQYQGMLDEIVAQHNAGHLIKITIHANNPMTGNNYHDVNLNVPAMLTNGTSENTAWKNDLDRYAAALAYLESEGVPVLFHPFHEIGNSSFWWCAWNTTITPSVYRDLWQFTFDYLTSTKGVHNLIWVFQGHINLTPRHVNQAPQHTGAPWTRQDWFVGDDWCDMHGWSSYIGPGAYTTSDINKLNAQRSVSGKPYAFCELGYIGSNSGGNPPWDMAVARNVLANNFPDTAYWVAWSGRHGIDRAANAGALMNDPRTALRDDVVAAL